MPIIALALILLMLVVIAYDASRYLIPNWLCGLLLLLYPVFLLTAPAPVDWPMALAAFAGVLALGYAAFAVGLMGGGDIKLLAVLSLWTGLAALFDFLIITALLGGALTLLLILARPALAYLPYPLPKLLQKGAPVPYGLAIAGAFLYLLWKNKIPGIML